jgi:hypothetical protein
MITLTIVDTNMFVKITKIGFFENKENINDINNPIIPKKTPKLIANLSMTKKYYLQGKY